MKSILRTGLLAGLIGILPIALSSQPTPSGDEQHPVVIMTTSAGPIILTLDARRAPETVKNFLEYAAAGYYDSTVFHRVIPGFMIQGGGFEAGTLRQKQTRSPIVNESPNGLTNIRGSIAMARRSDLNSATSQFYINLADNASLDRDRYAVFGQVTLGMETVDKIARVRTGSRGPMENVPVEDVIILSVTLNE